MCICTRATAYACNSFVLPLLSSVHSISFPPLHDPTRTISFLSFSFPDHFRPADPRRSVLVDAASVLRLVSVDARRRELFTNARDYRKFVGAAAGLRASWKKTGIVAFSAKQCSRIDDLERRTSTIFSTSFCFHFCPSVSVSFSHLYLSVASNAVADSCNFYLWRFGFRFSIATDTIDHDWFQFSSFSFFPVSLVFSRFQFLSSLPIHSQRRIQ